jgi:hypothetical protein
VVSKMTTDIEGWLLSFESGKKWYNTIASARTKEMYSKDLKLYCDAVGKTPKELLDLKVEGLQNVATHKEFQAEDLLDNTSTIHRMKKSLYISKCPFSVR